QEELTWPQYYDGLAWNNKVAQLYNVNSIPHTVLIDQNGVIHALGARAGSLSGKIESLLKKAR
ncbi:MAG TPA: thiol:disulfide interchange protein, partial [Blastocatellia bacterium]|nr:thiol:disulfide interchange protein [Blastocatellia bacterium]